ncbi:hypothetical protein AAF712_010880 [Marasmius tenuissimus]|uniref:Uncharacterized protein n=1 Tax=Marasmius tenuissimus TaxID=585030 RepID=A0ABR2ZKR2_9AGAR
MPEQPRGTNTNRGRDQNVNNGGGGSHVNNNHGGRMVVKIYTCDHGHRGENPSSTSRRSSALPSTASSHTTPHSSPNRPHDPSSAPLSETESLPQPELSGDNCTERSHSELYESLLLSYKLGFPRWMPSPHCASDGTYYTPEIGDVGFFKSHGLPFDTLFNITQPPSSPANRDGIPDGIDPPCRLEPRDVIEEGFHSSPTALSRPEGAISRQDMTPISRLCSPIRRFFSNATIHSVFTFHLSNKEGALLMLPHGSTSRDLKNNRKLIDRAQRYWRQWYDFADRQVYLDDCQALYLITGVGRCTTWAIAAWDSITSHARDDLGLLKLTVDGTICKWAFPPSRCSTRTSRPPASNNSQSHQETVFIRGFRIDRFKRSTHSRPTGPSRQLPGVEKDGNNDGDSNSGGNDPRDPPCSGDSSSDPSSLTHPTSSGGGHSGASNPESDSLYPPGDRTAHTLELNLNLYGDEDDSNSSQVTHPCGVINKFAFALVSCLKPALLESGCAAFSHDDDWINIIQESDEKFPPEAEIIRRICSSFKFTIEGGE